MKTLEDLGYVKTSVREGRYGHLEEYQRKGDACEWIIEVIEIVVGLGGLFPGSACKYWRDDKSKIWHPAAFNIDELKAVLAILEEKK